MEAGGTGDISPWAAENPPEPEVAEAFEGLIGQLRLVQEAVHATRPSLADLVEATSLLAKATDLLNATRTDEAGQLAGKQVQYDGRGQALVPPVHIEEQDPKRLAGSVTYSRYYLGGGDAAHGGALPLVFDEFLGRLAGSDQRARSRTAYLNVNFRSVTPLDRPVRIEAHVVREEGRKIFVAGTLKDGDRLLADAEALFVTLNPGQP